ncbi:hypothetical protein D3C81_1084270 [compost metagenome]
MAFGQDLRADQDARLIAERGQRLFQCIAARGGAAIDAQHRMIGEQLQQAFFQALGADALRLQRQAGAIRAGQRHRLTRAAVMALQATTSTMHGHRRGVQRRAAALARCGPTAVVAQQHRCVTPPVLEHQHLVAGFQVLADADQHFRRQSILQRTFAHIEDPHAGWLRITGALLQAQVRIAAAACVVQRFQRWRGTAQHHRHVQCLAAHQREVAGVIADAVLLLVAAVVFFVDDDQAGLRQRREDRRARADDHPCFATRCGCPHPRAFVVVQARMQRMHRDAQAAAEAGQHLRRQPDLRHQHQRLAALLQALADRLQIHLGLAAAGDTVEQEGLEAVAAVDGINGGLLLRVGRRAGAGIGLRNQCRHVHTLGEAALGQGAGSAAPIVELVVQQVFVDRTGFQQRGQPLRTGTGAQLGQAVAAGNGQFPGPAVGIRQGLATAQGRWQGGGNHFAQRGMGIARQPMQ